MFWGLTIEPGKHYTQTVEQSFHVSMVALDTRDVATSERDHGKLIQLMVQHEKAEFLVCTLCYGTVFQQSLDLNLTEGEEVTFFTEGRGTLHLTGYLVKDEPLTLDPDMMSLEEMSSSDDVASDSGDEDEMSDDAALFCATENAVPSLQELAATSLEDDEDENDDDEWKPQEKTSKRKKKQTRKSAKRPHLEEPQPRKAKQRATLAVAAELSKNGGDGSDSDEDTDEDFDPTEGTSQDGDEDFESDSDDDLLELEDEEEDEDDDEDMHVGVQSLGRKRDEKQQLKAMAGGRSSRILQTREVRAAKASPVKSPDKVNTAGNKENIADQQRYPQGKSSPKTPRSKGQTPRGQTSKGQTSKGQITDGQTQDGQTIEGQTNEGQTNDGQTPKGQTLRGQAPRGQSPKGQTPKGQAPKGQTPKGQVPAAKTPTVGKKGKVHQEGKSFKQETQANQTKTKLKTGKKMERQATPKKLRLAGGVVIEDLATGDGKAAKAGKMVHVYYSGRLASNGKQFDSCLSGKPFMFRIGRSEVIKGWDVGIAGMKIGGERRITVPASEGYGQKAVGPIPPNSTLVFNVTLKKVS